MFYQGEKLKQVFLKRNAIALALSRLMLCLTIRSGQFCRAMMLSVQMACFR